MSSPLGHAKSDLRKGLLERRQRTFGDPPRLGGLGGHSIATLRALYDLAARRADGELMSGGDAVLVAGALGPQSRSLAEVLLVGVKAAAK